MKNTQSNIYFIAAITALIPLIFTLYPYHVDAKSGACSGHRGVNCAAGADKDGSVICNDGWKKSTVSYASMKECRKKTK